MLLGFPWETSIPIRCPYCGSIENDGHTCKWCCNIINFTEVKHHGNHNDTDSHTGTGGGDRRSAGGQQAPESAGTALAAPQPAAVPAPTAVPVNTAVPVQQEPLPTGIPTQVRAYSVNDLAIACRPLMEAGKQPELQALLAEFGAPAGLASVPENRRAEFAGRLRQMGGQI